MTLDEWRAPEPVPGRLQGGGTSSYYFWPVTRMEGLELISRCTNITNPKNHLSLEELQVYNMTWSISAVVMGIICLIVFTTFLFAKAYRTPLQRLFLCLTFFTFLDEANTSLNMALNWPKLFNEKFCQTIGYVDVSIFITSLVLALGIGLFLLLVTYYHIQGRSLPKIGKLQSAVLEVTFLFLVIAIPPVTLEHKRDLFGVAGPFCWIKLYDGNVSNCEIKNISSAFEVRILSTYTAIMAINIAAFSLLITISCLLARRHVNVRLHHVHMAKKGSLLVIFLSLTFVIEIVSYWCHYKMVDSKTPLPFPVLIVMGIIVSISPAFIPLGFTIYLYSVRTVKLKALKDKVCTLGKSLLQRAAKSKELKSPQSQNEGDPSSEYTVSRAVGYTGAFTTAPSTYGSIERTTYSE